MMLQNSSLAPYQQPLPQTLTVSFADRQQRTNFGVTLCWVWKNPLWQMNPALQSMMDKFFKCPKKMEIDLSEEETAILIDYFSKYEIEFTCD